MDDITLSLQTVRNLISPEILAKAAERLDQADRILIFATAGNLSIAKSFQFQMTEIGKTVLVPEDEYEQRLLAAGANSNDFIILVSFAGRGKLACGLMDLFLEKKLNWLLISSAAFKAPAAHVLQLILPDQEDHADRISGFSMHSCLLYLFDLLYSTFFSLHYQENTDYKRKQYAILSTL